MKVGKKSTTPKKEPDSNQTPKKTDKTKKPGKKTTKKSKKLNYPLEIMQKFIKHLKSETLERKHYTKEVHEYLQHFPSCADIQLKNDQGFTYPSDRFYWRLFSHSNFFQTFLEVLKKTKIFLETHWKDNFGEYFWSSKKVPHQFNEIYELFLKESEAILKAYYKREYSSDLKILSDLIEKHNLVILKKAFKKYLAGNISPSPEKHQSNLVSFLNLEKKPESKKSIT